MIALLFITDRPHYAERTLASLGEMCPATFSHRIVVDDREHELGFAGAIAEGWRRVLETDAEYIAHLEDDFTFTCPVPLERMRRMLAADPGLAQVALKRQPWNPQERAAGGIVEQHPEDFTEVRSALGTLTQHRLFFTTNPSLYPRAIAERGWPQVEHSEGIFTRQLLDEGYHFAYLGGKYDPPRVLHIGERAGVGY